MGVGLGVVTGNLSYLAVGRETTYGTYNTCTAGINFLSAALKVTKETKILEEIQTSRTSSNYIQLGRTIEASMEAYYSPKSLACNYLLQNAFGGGAVTSATATGDTTGASTFTHTVDINNFLATYSSLCMNVRKGDSTNGKVFEYCGLRVNEFTLSAELDDALKMSISAIGKDASLTSNDVSSALNTVSQVPLSFVNGRFSVESTLSSLTSSSSWSVQSVEFKISNNLNGDSGSRAIGSDTIQVLPAGMANFELKATVRFDTTTAYSAMLAGSQFAAEFMFEGATMTGSKLKESVKFVMPVVYISDAGDPEIGGPNDPLTSEIIFSVLRQQTVGGYALKAYVTNNTSSYV
jgi:hypothetical protein